MVESALVFKPGFQLTGWDPPTLGRYNLLYSTDPNVNLIQKHPHRNTQKNVWTNIWAPHGPSQVDIQKNHTCPIRDNQSFNSKPDMLPWLFFTPLFAYELAIVLFDALLVVVVGREVWCAVVHRVAELDMTEWLNWTSWTIVSLFCPPLR